jgi:hypothetical protein
MLSYIIFLAAWISLFNSGESENPTVMLMKESYLEINGSSNINNFSCEYDFEAYYHKNRFSASYDGGIYCLDTLEVKIPVGNFDCGNRMLKKDFLKTLEYQSYPFITMQMQQLELSIRNDKMNSLVDLNIGGTSKLQRVNYQLLAIDETTFILEGQTNVDITDFNLRPVSRFFGMIKVDKDVEIRFLFKFVVE